MIALAFGLFFGFADGSSVQVTMFGMGMPNFEDASLEDCGPAVFGEEIDEDCYPRLAADLDDMECDYTLGFRASGASVTRLRVKIALMRNGKVIGRDSVQISNLERPEDDPFVTQEITGDCGAEQLRVTDAHATIDGQDVDLIENKEIAARGLIPLLPDFFIKIGAAET
jgi:hypothetical protein